MTQVTEKKTLTVKTSILTTPKAERLMPYIAFAAKAVI
jgi:hypothetical protein